jgi:ABC-2 type transport system ATP-binding protein
MSSTPAIAIRHLRKRYGQIEAVAGVSFEVLRGEIFGVMGPNGAGKTTTVECLLGLTEPDTGAIEIAGIDRRAEPDAVKRKVGAALQATALQDALTPREAVALFAALYGMDARPGALLDRFGLADKADAAYGTLSGGQQQRLALALAFVNDPEVVVLDEPTAGLDPQSRRQLHREIRSIRESGCTVLLTTHYAEEAAAICDRVAIIDRGRVVAVGAPDDLVEASHALPAISLTSAREIDGALLEALEGVRDLAVDGNRARFRTTRLARTLADLGRLIEEGHLTPASLHVEKATLEDVFFELTGAARPD